MIRLEGTTVNVIPPTGAKFLIGDMTDWEKSPIKINSEIQLDFPEKSYVEYAFLDSENKPFADPENALLAQNPWWTYPRAIMLEGFEFPKLPNPTIKPLLSRNRLESKILGANRRYMVYQCDVNPLTTVYVQDGVAYYRMGNMADKVQELFEQGKIQSLRLVFVEPEDRNHDYKFNLRYEQFLLEELLPAVEAEFGKTKRNALWGASLGGVVSLWLAFRNPETFPLVGAQSPCLTLEPNNPDAFQAKEWLTELFRESPAVGIKIFSETGIIEWLCEPNRRFEMVLVDKKYDHFYQEHASGHNWVTWRLGLEVGLHYLFHQTETV